jgi:transcriptional regulator with XRE-family HTH domain
MPDINGETLRAWRRSQGWDVPEMARQLRRVAQGQIADHDGLIRMIRDWERGRHKLTERYELLYAAALGIPPEQLLTGPSYGKERGEVPAQPVPAAAMTSRSSSLGAPPGASWAVGIYEAVLSPTDAARRATASPDGNGAPSSPLGTIQMTVGRAVRASLASDFEWLTRTLPRLIGEAEFANVQAQGADQRAVQILLSDVYATAAWALIKADTPGAAWIAAQRAIQAAENAGDVLRSAAATRCLAEVHMRGDDYGEATRTAFLAATYLYTVAQDKPVTLVLRGSAMLSAAAASARRGDPREARAALQAAAVCADQLAEDRCDLGTVFGPVNTAIHRVAVAVELGDAREAARHIPAVNLGRLPSHLSERRARFLIDVARTHVQLRDDRAAVHALLDAEHAAPNELCNHRLTKKVVRELLTRESRSSGLRALAARCNALD